MKLFRLSLAVIIVSISLLGVWQLVNQVTTQPVAAQDDDDEVLQEILDNISFRSIDEILDTELEVANFANDGTATLPIETSVSVACTIVYGTTEEFGNLSLDQDMAGGTHSVHSPLLSGLEPNTTYYFRVQGVDVDGVIYVSETMNFTTPELDIAEITNLASPELGATITNYSSAFGDAALDERWGASSAFDDNPNTQWATSGDGDNAWLEVELAAPASVHSVEFWSRAMNDGTSITLAFTVTTEDGTVFGPFEVPDTDQAYVFDVEIEAQTLRFDLIETTGGNTGVVNIAVYGEFLE